MQGKILDFSVSTNEGFISGNNNCRYRFKGSSWRENVNPERNMLVDFDIDKNSGEAIDIFICEINKKDITKNHTRKTTNGMAGYGIFSFIASIICLLIIIGMDDFSMSNEDGSDVIKGLFVFIASSIITGVISIKNNYDANKLGIAGLIISIFLLLMTICNI